MKKTEKSEIGGFTANTLIAPLAAILGVLIVIITILTMSVNWTSSDLADLMETSAENQRIATELQAGSSTLSETASNFAQMPLVGPPGHEQTNVGPLQAYATELQDKNDRRGPEIAAVFREQGVKDDIQKPIDAASGYAEQMRRVQEHTIALILSVYPTVDPKVESIPKPSLTEEELAMPGEARIAKAKQLIFGEDYSRTKNKLANCIEDCNAAIQEQFKVASTESKHHIFVLRTTLWVMISLIIVVMVITFVCFYRWLVQPLRQYSHQITSDQILKRKGAVRELRTLVLAHNDLLRRRNKLEAILRAAAETDALTGLPNRYSLERNALEIDEDGGTLAVMLFDVNYLKKMNDEHGHLAGDQLLRTAAICIRECFSAGTSDNCYRIGGDEFASILRDCTEEEVISRVERFGKALEREKISVSVGYAFTEEVKEGSFKRLMAIADKRMYEQKKETHERDQRLFGEEDKGALSEN